MNVLAELWVTVRDLISNKPMDLHMREHTQSTPGSAIRTALSSSPNHMALIVHSSPGSFASWFLVWVVFIDMSVQKHRHQLRACWKCRMGDQPQGPLFHSPGGHRAGESVNQYT